MNARRGGGKRWFYVAIGIVVVAGITTVSYLSSRSAQQVVGDATVTPIPNEGHVMGSDSALVELVEFADFECPACGQFANVTEPDIRTRLVNTGLIRFRFLDFPLVNIHQHTRNAHYAAWCAGEQGKFWEMHDLIFQNQDRWSTGATRRPDNVLGGLARQVGINMDQYESCVSTEKYRPQILANGTAGAERGINATPTFLVNNKILPPGSASYDELKKHIDEALTAARAAPGAAKAPPPAQGTKRP